MSAQSFYTEVFNPSGRKIPSILLVDKSRQSMVLVTADSSGFPAVLKEYRITTGRISGNKEKQGDLKTPEGIYLIRTQIPDEQLPPKYGPRAFVLNYPNFTDRFLNRSGLNIWIHGRDEEIMDYQTEGCISLENRKVMDLKPLIDDGKTVVIISDTLNRTDSAGYLALENHWISWLDTWRSSWQSGDLESYFSLYHQRFSEGSRSSFTAFKNKKRALEKRYTWKSIGLDSLLIYTSKEEVHIHFIQNYLCPDFYSCGDKELILLSVNGHWQITDENFSERSARIDVQPEFSKFLTQWIQAWESRDIQKYITFYHPDFRSDGMDYSSWKTDKTQKFQRTQGLSVQTGKLTISSEKPDEWIIRFKQDYRADNHKDSGYKTLTVTGFPKTLKILKEEWTATR